MIVSVVGREYSRGGGRSPPPNCPHRCIFSNVAATVSAYAWSDKRLAQPQQLAVALEPREQVALDCIDIRDVWEELWVALVDRARRKTVCEALDQRNPLGA